MGNPSRSLKQASHTCAAKLRVLADPTRLAVLEKLKAGPCHVGDLVKSLKIEQSLLSHHLSALRESGFVIAKRDGKSVLYGLTTAVEAGEGGSIDLGCCQLSFE